VNVRQWLSATQFILAFFFLSSPLAMRAAPARSGPVSSKGIDRKPSHLAMPEFSTDLANHPTFTVHSFRFSFTPYPAFAGFFMGRTDQRSRQKQTQPCLTSAFERKQLGQV